MIKSHRGTRDLLPPDTALWNFVEAAVRDVFRAYNFHEIRTPFLNPLNSSPEASAKRPTLCRKKCLRGTTVGRPVEDMLVPLWLNKHQGAFDSFELNFRVPGSRAEIDLVAVKENSVSLIEAKARADGHGITQLRNISDRWELSYPDQPRPRLVLLVPANTPIPDGLLASNTGMNLPEAEIAKIFNIVIETIDLPEDTEYPQSLTLRPENTAGIVRAISNTSCGSGD